MRWGSTVFQPSGQARYKVTATIPGFAVFVREEVTVTTGVTTVDATLTVGTIAREPETSSPTPTGGETAKPAGKEGPVSTREENAGHRRTVAWSGVFTLVALLLIGLGTANRRARLKSHLARTTAEFFARPSPGRRWYDVVAWWDSRRLTFSVFVLVIGLLSSLGWFLAAAFSRTDPYAENPLGLDTGLFWIATAVGWPILLMILANAWYTGGWIAELVIRIVLRDHWLWLGPAMLIAGTLFSLLFTVGMSYPVLAAIGTTAIVSVPLTLLFWVWSMLKFGEF